MTREKIAWPIEWVFSTTCGLFLHAGSCRIAATYYNSRFARWAYRWHK